DRGSLFFRAERQFNRALRLRGLTSWQHITFAAESDNVTNLGGEVIFDTRLDPFLARDAIYARATQSHLSFGERPGVNRTELEAHGYLGLIGQTILVASAKSETGDGPLPDYLKPLFGGPNNVRGFKVGETAGDSLVAGSLELRVPLTPALSFGKIG